MGACLPVGRDLNSGPLLGVYPSLAEKHCSTSPRQRRWRNLYQLEPTAGLEPATHALRKHCSTTELRRLGSSALISTGVNRIFLVITFLIWSGKREISLFGNPRFPTDLSGKPSCPAFLLRENTVFSRPLSRSIPDLPKIFRPQEIRMSLERETGIEPAAYCLGSNRSTTELFPHKYF